MNKQNETNRPKSGKTRSKTGKTLADRQIPTQN